MKQFYCYLYKVDGIYRYIGKGTGRRVVDHLKFRDRDKGGNQAFISHLRNQKELGIEPEIEVIFCESEQEAHDIETTYIAEFGRLCTGDGPLFNITLGGEGTSGWAPSSEWRAKNSASRKGQIPWNKGVPIQDEQKTKLSIKMKGQPPFNKGKKASVETRISMSVAKKGKPSNNKGKIMSDKGRANLSASKIGKNLLVIFINSAGDIKKFRLGDIIPNEYNFKVKYPPKRQKYCLSPKRVLILN